MKTLARRGIFLLLLVAVLWLVVSLFPSTQPGRLNLPVGHGTPAISLGERHGLILASDGSLWTWGADLLGWPVLGLGSNTMKSTTLRRIGHDTNWAAISATGERNVALKSDGTLWTWGESVTMPGKGPTPIYTPVPAAPGNDWAQVSAGGVHVVAIKKDGTLWAWGHNWAGSVGVPSVKGSLVPLQVGSATNWVKIWAGLLETVAMQSDGSLWYWGENPDPTFAQGTNQIFEPTRVSPDTNWVSIGFGVNTVLAVKSDGTLWTWGRQAHVLLGSNSTNLDAVPARLGTNSDWRALAPATGWWSIGLIKQDGSLWYLDASDGRPNGPVPPYRAVQFRPVPFPRPYAAYAAGAAHAAPPGVHGPLGVILTPDGEVWTWGMVLGDPPTFQSRLAGAAVKLLRKVNVNIPDRDPEPNPTYRRELWELRNLPPDAPSP
jgi:hypothetical protein